MKFQFYSDPGHGWAKVKRSLLKELGIEDKISSYSYQKGEFVYLEEDCDQYLFWKTMKDQGREVEYIQHNCNGSSSIRNYDSFQPQGSVKYYLLSILTRCGEFEFTQEITIKVEEDVKVENAAREVVANWYDDGDPGGRDGPNDNGEYWFDNGNVVCCNRITEISENEYEIFKKYGI